MVGTSYIASNISSEHFIGMIGAVYIYGVALAAYEWGTLIAFSFLIWIFIPFLLSSRIFTVPEYLEKRFNPTVRHFFAIVTIICNVFTFLAAVLYGGGLALHKLFGWNLWLSIVVLGVTAGSWAIYGGLRSVAWTDLMTVIIMFVGGIMVSILGLLMLSGDSHSLIEGFKIMIERNTAESGIWAEVVQKNLKYIVEGDQYNRLSVMQPLSHQVAPWTLWVFSHFSLGFWYLVLNQFMVQRILGAKNLYHARMGMVLAGYMKILLPVIIVIPGLVLFAKYPEVMQLPWDQIRPEADKGYVQLLQVLIPIGFRGLFLAALFGAIQSTINSVLNSTATIYTLDIFKRMINKNASDKKTVRVGVWSSVIILVLAILMAGFISNLRGSLFVYMQTLNNFFAPPFSAIFLVGIFWRRINGKGAAAAVVAGFVFAILLKVYTFIPGHLLWLEPYINQGIVIWLFSTIVCIVVSLRTAPPSPEQVTDKLALNWKKLNIERDSATKWYKGITFWWLLSLVIVLALILIFSVVL